MSLLKIERVLALPALLSPSAMYIVQASQAARAELFFTDTAGTLARHIIDEADVNAIVSSAIANFSAIEVTANIAARDALSLSANAIVLVIDATADATVAAGAATYVYDFATTTWSKISEFATIDAVINWSNIVGTPSSTVAAIDDTVAKRHVHINTAQLALVGEDVNGAMTYNGVNPEAYVSVSDW